MNPTRPDYIITSRGVGYRFVGSLTCATKKTGDARCITGLVLNLAYENAVSTTARQPEPLPHQYPVPEHPLRHYPEHQAAAHQYQVLAW